MVMSLFRKSSKRGSTIHVFRWVWLNCPLSGVFYDYEYTIGDGLLSVTRSSGVSTIHGFLMY